MKSCVGAYALTGADQQDIADDELAGGDGLLGRTGLPGPLGPGPVAVRRQPGGGRRGEVGVAAHGVGGAGRGHGLQGAGGGEDDDQQRAVQDLPDRGRAERRHDHQQVDVERLLTQRPQPFESGFPEPAA
jgi:hypothetical protein